MGSLSSTSTSSKHAVNAIDAVINQYKAMQQITYKSLLLGTNQSGKSTMLKQLRYVLVYDQQYDQSELLAAKQYLTQNVIKVMKTLAIYSDIFFWTPDQYLVSGYLRIKCLQHYYFVPTCIEQLCLSFFAGCQKNKEICNLVARMNDQQRFTEQHYKYFVCLLNEARIKMTFELRYKGRFKIMDNATYLFDNMHNYWKDNYIPTFQDFTHLYQQTTALDKFKYTLCDHHGAYEEIYEIFDVGTQENERRKWIHFFDNVSAVMFVVSLSGYNEFDNRNNNRMYESIRLFDIIVNLDVFKDISFILFLNKSDLFQQKIGKYPVKEHFKDFDGNESYDEIIQFFKHKFRAQIRDKRDRMMDIYFHVICATDINWIRKMIESVRTIVIKKELFLQGYRL